MIEYETRLKKWGNSVGIVIPKEKVKKEKLRERQAVRVIVSPVKPVKVKDIFGKLKKWKKSTKILTKEADRKLDIKF